MRKIPLLFLPVVWLLADPGEQLAPLEREGDFWVERTGGTIGAGDAPPFLRIETRGDVIFQGDGGSSLGYQIERRVQARSEAEARRLLTSPMGGGAAAIKPVRIGDQLSLIAHPGPRVVVDIKVQPPRALRQVVVETEAGAVEVRDVRAPVNVNSGAGPVLCDRIVGALSVRTGGGDLVLGNITGAVRVRSGSGMVRLRQCSGEASLETAGGEIAVDEVSGPLYALTGAGNIEVGRAGGRVEAHTRGGLIRVREAGGEVVAESAGGGIVIGSARGVRCESAAGTVKLTGVAGQVQVTTTVGSIFAELQAGRPWLGSLLSAARGDITVWIPAGLALSIAALADSAHGRIISEFSEVPVSQVAMGGELRCSARGSLNGGGPLLRLAAGDGVVYLRKR